MTIGEIVRQCEGITYRKENERKEKAAYDYTLAILIGKATVGSMGKSHKFPSLEEAYPEIYNPTTPTNSDKPKEEPKIDTTQKSMARFLNFANNYNLRRNQSEDKQC